MANRRCIHSLVSRCFAASLSNPNPCLHPLYETLTPHCIQTEFKSLETLKTTKSLTSPNFRTPFSLFSRNFCSNNRVNNSDEDEDDEDEDEDDDENEAEESGDDEIEDVRAKSDEEKAREASEIGYKVMGPLQESDRVFKRYEPVFAVVQIGSHQFKVSNRDSIFTEKLKYCDVNDKLILNRVLMLGSKTQTMIGRPVLPDAKVHAVVEEHALDAKVIIFKKKRRKNYRRTKGHRQELTKLRITDIEGIEKPEMMPSLKTEKTAVKKSEKVAVAA